MPFLVDKWLRPDPKNPIGLVLSGGGARGAFQVGAWKVLLSDPRGLGAPPDIISGTSAGALNAALIAAGLLPEEILEFWLDLADNPPLVANELFFKSLADGIQRMVLREVLRPVGRRSRELRILLSQFQKHRFYTKSGLWAMLLQWLVTARFDTLSELIDGIATPFLFDITLAKGRLAKAIGATELRRTKVRLAINTVDMRTGDVVRIVNHKPEYVARASSRLYRYEPTITLDMVLASAAIPVLFNPVRVGAQDLWDGGLLVNSPMAPAVALGASRIVPVLVTTKQARSEAMLRTFGGAVERLVDAFLENAYNIDRKLLLDRNALAGRLVDDDLHAVELFRAIRPQTSALFNAGSYLAFERKTMLAMYEAGQQSAREWLSRGPEVDSRDEEE